MKRGDQLEVKIEGIVVAYGVVESVEAGRVTIYIPPTRVIMGARVVLEDEVETNDEKHVVVLGPDE